jgi:hypothetical protein
MRILLSENQTIKLALTTNEQQSHEFTIQNMLGEGASCIAYRATNTGSGLPVVLKECFPSNVATRTSDGTVTWNSPADEAQAKERFRRSFETQRKIQSSDEMMNTGTHLIDGLYSGNNTLYTVTNIENARTYDAVNDSSLQQICKTTKAIAEAVGKYHNHGFLHLDIKPENVMVFPETREMVRLLDFDSVIQKSDVNRPGAILSYSPTYAAPEQLQGKRGKICEATDIYAIGAVIFSKVFGHAPTTDDRSVFSDWDLKENKYFKRLSNKAHRLIKEILHQTLPVSIKKRYQSTDELVEALDELIIESDPKRRYMNSTCHISRNYFAGRGEELRDIHTAFSSGKCTVFVYGMGGFGKTELALHYAERYKSHYDVIAFGRYNDSLDNLFKSAEFISIENNSEGETNLDAVRALANARTLLIIDNFDVDTDPKLDAALSLKCNLLFTNRRSFAEEYSNDSAVAHIKVGELPASEQEEIFKHECGRTLGDEELTALRLILKEIDGYTLLIPLIAKTFKNDNYSLTEIQRHIHEAGIKDTSDIKVWHHKDSALSDTLYNILCEVMSMAKLSDDEIHVMRSLALLGGIVISRKEFNSWLDNKYKNAVKSLVDKGWVQCNGSGAEARISLHKVIGELARDVLKPDLQNCSEIRNKIWDESVKFRNNQKHSRKDWHFGYANALMLPDEIFYYNALCSLLVELLKNCDLENQYDIDFLVRVISNIVNPICGGIEEFKNFLLFYIKQFYANVLLDKIEAAFDNGNAPKEHSPECLYNANMALMTFALCNQLGERNERVLSYAKEAKSHADTFSKIANLSNERTGYMYFTICLTMYQRICAINYDHEAYCEIIPKFDELAKYIEELWIEARDKFKNWEEIPFENEYNDYCFWISDEGINYADDRYKVDKEDWFEAKQIAEKLQAANKASIEKLSPMDASALLTTRDIEQKLNLLIGEVTSIASLWIVFCDTTWDSSTQSIKLKEISALDTFEGIHVPEIVGKNDVVANLAMMEAAFSYCYSCAGAFDKCKEHLRYLLKYYKMYRYNNEPEEIEGLYTGAAFNQTDARLPGAATLLGKYHRVLPPELALFFIDGLLKIMEEFNDMCGYNNHRLYEGYVKAIEFACEANNSEKETFYKQRIADTTDIHYSFGSETHDNNNDDDFYDDDDEEWDGNVYDDGE